MARIGRRRRPGASYVVLALDIAAAAINECATGETPPPVPTASGLVAPEETTVAKKPSAPVPSAPAKPARATRQPAPELPAGMRQCKGSAKFGIAPHIAPVGDFAVQASQRDGLASMCRTDWARYTHALRLAAADRGESWALPKASRLPGPAPVQPAELEPGVAAEASSVDRAAAAAKPARTARPKKGQAPARSAAEVKADREAAAALRAQLRGSAAAAKPEPIRTRAPRAQAKADPGAGVVAGVDLEREAAVEVALESAVS